jgi:hypothetical protein
VVGAEPAQLALAVGDLDLKPPDSSARLRVQAESKPQSLQVSRRDLLGGLIHEYDIAAAA